MPETERNAKRRSGALETDTEVLTDDKAQPARWNSRTELPSVPRSRPRSPPISKKEGSESRECPALDRAEDAGRQGEKRPERH